MKIPDNIYFYGTCLVDLLYPQSGLSAMALIKSAGVNVIYPKQQSCCGQPAFNSAYRADAIKVAFWSVKNCRYRADFSLWSRCVNGPKELIMIIRE